MVNWLLKLRWLAVVIAFFGALHAIAFVVLGAIRGIEGYRLLGLEEHARVAAGVAEALAAGIGRDEREDLEETWFSEIGSDAERAAWIQTHPEAFRT